MPQAPHRGRARLPRPAAFTLVELLVVLGIIAVLIGVLLPVLSGVAARGRDVQCQSNLRGILQAMHGYAAENRGQFPWGLVNNRMLSNSLRPEPGFKGETIGWAALVASHWNRRPPLVARLGDEGPAGELEAIFTTAMRCPDAAQYRPHVVSYAMSMVVGAAPYMDVHLGSDTPPPIGALVRPVKQAQLRDDTAVLWDTALVVGTEYAPQLRMGADIDGQRIWLGAKTPQYRFYSMRDPFHDIPPGNFGYGRPLQLNMPGWAYRNRETVSESDIWPYQGNLRFRHRKNTACNVAFADGSVRQFTAKVNPDRTVRSHDAVRRHFMLKWPPGIPPDPNSPF